MNNGVTTKQQSKIGKRQSTSCLHPRVVQENHIGEKGSIFTVFLSYKNKIDQAFQGQKL